MILKIYKKNRRIFFLLLTFILFPFAIAGIYNLKLDTDVFKLMPKGNKTFESFKKSVELFGGIDNIIIFIQIPNKDDLELYISFADELCEELSKIEEGMEVLCHPPDPKPYFEFFLKNIVILSNDSEWLKAKEIFEKENMSKILKETKLEMSSILDPEIKSFLLLDPLKFHRIYWERFNKPVGSFKIDYMSGYFLSEDHSSILIILKPRGTAQDIKYSTEIVGKIEKKIGEIINKWDYESPKPLIYVGGGFKIAVEDAKIIKKDIILQIFTSLVLVLLLYYFSFRNFRTLFFPIIPLGLGMIFTFGFAGWFIKELNVSSSAFAALLVGLGIDFVILIYSRFIEERANEDDYNKILYIIEMEVFPSILIGAITTIGTFGIFYFTKLKGLKELGVLTSIGILFVMFFAFTILPILLLLEKKIQKKDRSLYKIFLFSVNSIIEFSIKKKLLVIFLSFFILFLSLFFIIKIPFQDTAEALRSKNNKGIIVQEKISEKFGRVGYPSVVLIESNDLNKIITADENLSNFLDNLKQKNIVYSHQGISDLIPSLEKQRKNLKRIEEINYLQFKNDFEEICKELDLNLEVFQKFLNDIKFALSESKILDWENLSKFEDQIRLNQVIYKEKQKYYTFRTIYFPEGKYKREPPIELEEYTKNNPEMVLTGINAMAKELRILVKRDAYIATTVGFVLVFLILYLFFKSFKNVIVTLVPLIFGISFMLGFMGILKIPFNSMNIFVTLMIVGIGSDYGIHFLHRFHLSKGNIEKISHTSGAILFSALTTIAGFGSLILSHFLGLKSMGYIAIIGTFFVLLFTLTLLPAILKKD